MKYARLTKEQLEELKPEFINFLATQSITGDEWATIKEKQPQVAEEEIDVFSDLVWEGVLTKAQYLEHVSPNQMHLFLLGEVNMSLIAVKINKEDIDITTAEGYAWLKENLGDDDVVFMSASKDYSADRNADKFKLISEGAVITRGDLYKWFARFVEVK
jgi:cag pathogenicity island protein 24